MTPENNGKAKPNSNKQKNATEVKLRTSQSVMQKKIAAKTSRLEETSRLSAPKTGRTSTTIAGLDNVCTQWQPELAIVTSLKPEKKS